MKRTGSKAKSAGPAKAPKSGKSSKSPKAVETAAAAKPAEAAKKDGPPAVDPVAAAAAAKAANAVQSRTIFLTASGKAENDRFVAYRRNWDGAATAVFLLAAVAAAVYYWFYLRPAGTPAATTAAPGVIGSVVAAAKDWGPIIGLVVGLAVLAMALAGGARFVARRQAKTAGVPEPEPLAAPAVVLPEPLAPPVAKAGRGFEFTKTSNRFWLPITAGTKEVYGHLAVVNGVKYVLKMQSELKNTVEKRWFTDLTDVEQAAEFKRMLDLRKDEAVTLEFAKANNVGLSGKALSGKARK
jgi:hypothetical protein